MEIFYWLLEISDYIHFQYSEIKVLLGDCERHIPINEMGLEVDI